LETVAWLVGSVVMGGMVIQPATELWRFLRMPARFRRVSSQRARATVAGGLVAVLAIVIIPLPHHVYGTLELRPQHAQMLYVEVPGQLVEVCAPEGSAVEAGQTVARLENLDLDLAIARLTAKRDEWKSKLDTARRQRFEDPAASPQVAEIEKTLASFEEQLAEKQRDRSRLNLVAQHAGTVLPGSEAPETPTNREELRMWSGSPFDAKNRGCSLSEGTTFCLIGDPARYDAMVVFDQADIEWVRSGQRVRVKLDELPHTTLDGAIEEVSRSDLRVTPKPLSNKSGGELATRTDAAGVERPMSVSYQARVPLDGADAEDLRRGLRGRAKIDVGWSSLGSRAWRSFCQTFYFTF
jgi:putative peptide zinc metalloprotease protein